MKHFVLLIILVTLVISTNVPASAHIPAPESGRFVQEETPSFDYRFDCDLGVKYPSVSWTTADWIRLRVARRYAEKPYVRLSNAGWVICHNNPVNRVNLDGRVDFKNGYMSGGDFPSEDLWQPSLSGPLSNPREAGKQSRIVTRATWRGGNYSRLKNLSIFDERGKELFGRWLNRNGGEIELTTKNWQEYMMTNEKLTYSLQDFVTSQAFWNDGKWGLRDTSGKIDVTFKQIIENGYLTGYEMLHGTDTDVGDFQISGSVSITFNEQMHQIMEFDLEYVWNDIMNPNYKYREDEIFAKWCRKIYPEAADYSVHIRWSGKCKYENFSFSGYPFD